MSSPRPGVMIVSTAHEMGGAEVYLLTLLQALAGGVAVDVVISDRAPAELPRRVHEAGAGVTSVRGLARRPSPRTTVRLARLLERRRPALVHVNLSDQGDGIAAIAAAALVRLPVTATLHLVIPERRRSLEWLSRRCLRAAREVIAVSDWVGEYLRRQGASATVVPNGVATPRVVPDARRELGALTGEIVVGGIGRLDRQKGWDVLCAAAPRVHERVPTARFVVVGDGPERARLLAGDGSGRVHFLGYREHAADLCCGMDVLAVPSRYEGFGLVAVEAMLAGVPVIASRVGSLPEVVGDAGRLVAPEDPEALAEALISLLEDPDRRAEFGRRGAQRARDRFGLERMCGQTLDVWRRAARVSALNPPVGFSR